MQDTAAPPEETLICPACQIFDVESVRIALDTAAGEIGRDAMALRKAAVGILSEAQKRGRAAIAEALGAHPFSAIAATRSYSWLADCIILATLDLATRHMHPLPTPTDSERIAVLAVGGSGRGEMAPQSDVDLLFLTPYKITPWAESVIESMLYILWDLRLKVGHFRW